MELVYLILPIVGAFLLIFIVCCCGNKVKELFHIPKEVVTGGYRIASTRDYGIEGSMELQAQGSNRNASGDPLLTSQPSPSPVPRRPAASETSHIYCDDDDIIEMSEADTSVVLMPRAPRLSERDSGVYSVCENSVGCISNQVTPNPNPRPRWQQQQHQQPRELCHSFSEDSQSQTFVHKSEDSGSCILNVRSRTCSGDTNNTDPILESEYEMEDAGICILHVSPQNVDMRSLSGDEVNGTGGSIAQTEIEIKEEEECTEPASDAQKLGSSCGKGAGPGEESHLTTSGACQGVNYSTEGETGKTVAALQNIQCRADNESKISVPLPFTGTTEGSLEQNCDDTATAETGCEEISQQVITADSVS